MEDSTNILGKKVFFLYPHSVMKSSLLEILIQYEYEIYLISSHKIVAGLAEKFPGSILFVNIDEALSHREWEDFIRGLINNPETGSLQIGVITSNKNEKLSRKFLFELMIPCGFIVLKQGLETSASVILKMLEANEAKGRRKYVRGFCENQPKTSFNTVVENVLYAGKIIDISVVGMAVTFDDDIEFSMKTRLENIQLILKGIVCRVSGVVIRKSGGFRDCFCLSYWDVSPCLTCTSIPSSLPHHCIRESISRFKARSGVIYRADIPILCSRGVSIIASNIGRTADSVLPEPVGAMRKV